MRDQRFLRNTKQLKSNTFKTQLDAVLQTQPNLKTARTNRALELFVQYCINHTSVCDLSEISLSTLESYISHHLLQPSKHKSYDSFKRLKDDALLLEQILLNEEEDIQSLDFSLMNLSLWSSRRLNQEISGRCMPNEKRIVLH